MQRSPALRLAAVLVGLGTAVPLSAGEATNPARLSVERIFDSKEFEPEKVSVQWLEHGSGYVALEECEESWGGQDVVRYDAGTGTRDLFVPAAHLIPPRHSSPLVIEGFSFTKDHGVMLIYTNSQRVWRTNTRGDYWVLDRTSRELRQLGGDARPSSLMFAKLSPTGRHAAYVRENDIYVEDLRDGRITALTTSGSADIINGTFDWVYEEELGLRDGFRWSPDGKSIAYWQLNTGGVREFALIDNSDGLYSRVLPIKYPKVGQRNAACRVGVVDLSDRKTRWLEVPGSPRDHYIARMDWAAGSKEIVLQQLNRRQDTNRVMLADARTGKVQTVLTEQDEAWVDVHDDLEWFSDGKRFTWLSERDGWRHVYLVSRDGKKVRCVTPGEYDVVRLLKVDEKRDRLYFTASPDHPTQQYLYCIGLDGTGLQRLTPDVPGTHDYRISPDGQFAFHTASSFDAPPRTDLVTLPEHERTRTLASNQRLRKRVARLDRRPGEFFRVDIGGGVLLDAWCIKPPQLDPRQKHPLLIHVYGEPAGRTVADRWGGTNYLWHLMLAQQGYVVMSFDNRGTNVPRGRAWRKSVHRQIGILAPKDQAAALRQVLADREYLDADRVGVWGWSGGGSMSLNAIFKYPDLYHTAIAVAPVSNQRYYDTIYQERYMGLPGDNVEGFLKGSPISFAHRLQGNLLLVHGTGDDNCHYQATEALINELITHQKHFSMMAYPNRSHSISEGLNTSRHLRALLTRYLRENLPPGPGADSSPPTKP